MWDGVTGCRDMAYGTLMRRMMAVLMLLAGSAQAQPVTDAGVTTCEAWGAHRKATDAGLAVADAQWVLGFLSGIGHMHLGELEPRHGTTPQQVWQWIDTYCGSHPTETIASAAAAFTVAHPR